MKSPFYPLFEPILFSNWRRPPPPNSAIDYMSQLECMHLRPPNSLSAKSLFLLLWELVDLLLLFVSKSCPTLCDPTDCSTPGSFVLHCILEFGQIHVHWVGDAISPSHPLLLPSPLAFSLSKHQGLFQLKLVIPAKAHLTSDSRMSGSRWVTIPSWLSGSLRPYLYSSFVYSCHLFLIPFASVRFLLFLSFITPILAWNVPLRSPMLFKRDCPSFPFCCFPLFLCIVHLRRPSYFSLLFFGTVHSDGCIFHFSPLPYISPLSSAICQASSDSHFAFLHLFFFGMVLVTASSTVLQTSIHSSSGCLSTRLNPLNLLATSTV